MSEREITFLYKEPRLEACAHHAFLINKGVYFSVEQAKERILEVVKSYKNMVKQNSENTICIATGGFVVAFHAVDTEDNTVVVQFYIDPYIADLDNFEREHTKPFIEI